MVRPKASGAVRGQGYSFANWLTAAETSTRGWTDGVAPQRLPAPAAATAHAITRLPCDRPRRYDRAHGHRLAMSSAGVAPAPLLPGAPETPQGSAFRSGHSVALLPAGRPRQSAIFPPDDYVFRIGCALLRLSRLHTAPRQVGEYGPAACSQPYHGSTHLRGVRTQDR
jgi:hypothetical protein